MSRTLAIASLLVVAVGCATAGGSAGAPTQHSATPALATNTSRSQQQGGADSMLVCEMEKPTGSNIPERVCRRATPDEVERMKVQNTVKEMQRSGPRQN